MSGLRAHGHVPDTITSRCTSTSILSRIGHALWRSNPPHPSSLNIGLALRRTVPTCDPFTSKRGFMRAYDQIRSGRPSCNETDLRDLRYAQCVFQNKLFGQDVQNFETSLACAVVHKGTAM